MATVIVNNSLRTQLPDLSREIEFRDDSGKTLGWFLPTELYKQIILSSARMVETELERRPQQSSGQSLGDIHNDECLEIVMDGPADTTVRPMPPRAVLFELERRQRHAHLMKLWNQQQEQEKGKESSDANKGRDSMQGT